MPTTIILTNLNTSGFAYEITAIDSVYILMPGVSVTSTGTVFYDGGSWSGAQVLLAGSIATNSAYCVTLNGANSVVRLAPSALAVSTWFSELPSYPVISIGGVNGSFANAGTIMTGTGTGVGLYGANSAGTNSGRIEAGQEGVSLGVDCSFINEGVITASRAGFNTGGVTLGGDGGQLHNTGTISAAGSSGSAGVAVWSDAASVQNTGTITCATGWGVRVNSGTGLTVVNAGTIAGSEATGSIQASAGSDSITNRGLLMGDVDLGGGADLFDGLGGTVTGRVLGGAGDDVYRLDREVAIVEAVDGGTDRIEATVSFDLGKLANVEDLTLLETAVLGTGNGLANTITGNLANNRLNGAGGNDTINGGDGDDQLRGGAGRDVMGGGDGEDSLRGGLGNDRLTGGDEADSFQYRTLADSGTTTATRDQIVDFTPGLDRIDLARLDANANLGGNQAFSFIGGAAFGNVAGQLRFGTVGGRQMVEADVNGDGVADFQIELLGVPGLSGADFVL